MKKCAWDRYSKFAFDFETTYHKPEPNDNEILNYDRQTFAITDSPTLDFSPNENSQVFLAGLMSLNNYEYRLSYENLAEFVNNIAEMTYNERHTEAVCYAHNLAYDGEYLLKWLIKNGYKQTLRIDKLTFKPMIKRKEFSLLKSGGKFFSMTIWWRGIKIHFLDSMKIFPMSLASLGETIGYEKLYDLVDYSKFQLDKSHNYPKDWLTYLKRDCEILAKFLKIFFEKENKSHTLKRQTIGSISYSYMKPIISKLTPKFTIKDYNLFEHWFHGGLTFPSFKYWGKWVYKPNKIKMIDECSAYPTAMCKELPYGKPMTKPPKTSKYCAFYKVRIKHAKIREEYNDIACLWKPFELKNGKKILHLTKFSTNYQYIQEVENEIYYFTDIELEMLQQLYVMDIKIMRTYYFKKKAYLKEIVQAMFQDKKNAKAQGKLAELTISKLKLNSPYGKTSQKPIRQQDFYGDKNKIDTTKYKIVGKKQDKNVEAYNIEKIHSEDEKASPIFLGCYITALARVQLLTMYKYITDNGAIFLYTDTDSIAFWEKKAINFTGMIGNDLGLWEFEKFKQYKLDKNLHFVLDKHGDKILEKTTQVADLFCALCPKQYRICVENYPYPVKFASAGIKKNLIEIVLSKDYNYDLGSNKNYNIMKTQLKATDYGKEIVEVPFNFEKWKKLKPNPIYPRKLMKQQILWENILFQKRNLKNKDLHKSK